MITFFQAAVLGLLQGITELFPISSLGHSVILPKLIGWNINQNDPFFLTFLIGTHLATALVLFFFFWKDWLNIFKGLGRSVVKMRISPEDYYAKLGWLLIIGTIPAGIIGLLLEKKIRLLFANPLLAAVFLIVNGIMLFGAEKLRKQAPQNLSTSSPDQHIASLNWWQSLKVGLAQVLALVPGMSRSGATMTGSLLLGLSHEDALRFSFLLSTPIIGAAAVLKLPQLSQPANHHLIAPTLLGAVFAAAGAYISAKFLVNYFKTNKLTPFAIYSLAAGIIFSLILYFR